MAACCSECPPSSYSVVFVDLAEGTTATTITFADSIDSNLELWSINVAAGDAFVVNGIVIEGFNELRERLAFSAASSSDG